MVYRENNRSNIMSLSKEVIERDDRSYQKRIKLDKMIEEKLKYMNYTQVCVGLDKENGFTYDGFSNGNPVYTVVTVRAFCETSLIYDPEGFNIPAYKSQRIDKSFIDIPNVELLEGVLQYFEYNMG